MAQDNHDPVTGVVPGADGIKTGLHPGSRVQLSSARAKRGGRRLVMVIGAVPSARLAQPGRARPAQLGFRGLRQPGAVLPRGCRGRRCASAGRHQLDRAAPHQAAEVLASFPHGAAQQASDAVDPLSRPDLGADREGPGSSPCSTSRCPASARTMRHWSPPKTCPRLADPPPDQRRGGASIFVTRVSTSGPLRGVRSKAGKGPASRPRPACSPKLCAPAASKCLLTREPGGTPGAEAIRALLLDPPGEGWGVFLAEALLFAAPRRPRRTAIRN